MMLPLCDPATRNIFKEILNQKSIFHRVGNLYFAIALLHLYFFSAGQ